MYLAVKMGEELVKKCHGALYVYFSTHKGIVLRVKFSPVSFGF